jgi:hypothetical protein
MKRLALTLLAVALVAVVATSTASAKRLKVHTTSHAVQTHVAKVASGSHALRRLHRDL